MVITENTHTMAVLPFMTKDDFDRLVDECDEVPLDKSVFDMTCGEFIETLDDGYAAKFLEEEYILAAAGKIKRYKREMEMLDRYLRLNDFKPSPEEERAKAGITFPTFAESILMTVTEYFHLKSFEEAESIPFSNYLLINKSQNATAKYDRNYRKITEEKARRKK